MKAESEHVSARLMQLFVERELSTAQSEEVRRHLDGCAGCRETVEEIRTVRETLKSDACSGPLRPVWPQVEAGLRRREARRLSFVSGLSAAAGLLIAVLIGARTESASAQGWTTFDFAFSPERDVAVAELLSSVENEGSEP